MTTYQLAIFGVVLIACIISMTVLASIKLVDATTAMQLLYVIVGGVLTYITPMAKKEQP